tara:strand:+ start:1354 stop:1695 length:342 start_codon:yes stop_codon:yes gene_type:complete
MANPGTYDFTLQRRVDHSFDINLKDGNNANENLTGKTILSQIWNESRTTKLADATITVTDASGGDITWSVTDVQTTNMTDNTYRYDILKIEANGDREYFIEGRIFMSEGYTAQ